MVRTERLVCALRHPADRFQGASTPLVVLEVLVAEYFHVGATRVASIDPCDIWTDRVQVEEWRRALVGSTWQSFNAAAQQVRAPRPVRAAASSV